MGKKQWHPGTLLQTSGSYWEAFTLHVGVKLDVFSLLSNTFMSAEKTAEKIGADTRAVSIMLNALTAMGLLAKEKGGYRASEEARKFLDRNSETYIGHIIMHHHYLAESWGRLEDAIITGEPTRSRASFADTKRREAFLMGMYNMASQQARGIAALVDLSGCKKLLDFGGGPGTYAIHFCLQYTNLEASIFDLPTTKPIAEKIVAKHGLSDRIEFIAGDYLEDINLSDHYDAAWLSHILHGSGPESCEKIIAEATGALMPGAMIFIHDFILNDNMDGPVFPALFALNMLLGTHDGQAYSEKQIRGMLENAGITDVERLPYVGPTESGIMVGKKG